MSEDYKIRIQQYHLFDIKLKSQQLLKFMSDTFSLVSDNEAAFSDIKGGSDIFHNRRNTYSLIQFNADKAYPVLTAYGDNAIKALDIWFELFRKNNPEQSQNFQQNTENYRFIPQAEKYTYRIKDFLINHERYDSIKHANKQEFNDGLGQYVVNMFLVFLKELSYKANENPLRIEAKIIKSNKKKQFVKPFKYASKFAAYDITFTINVRLPETIAFGIATARGFGVVEHLQ